MSPISVVIPLFNKSGAIAACIDSVLRQTCMPIEIIIVNDGSTDDSLALVTAMNNPLLVVVSQANHGVSHARNVGLELAKAELVAFLDADDLWLSTHLEEMAKLSLVSPDSDIWSCGFKTVQPERERIVSIGPNVAKFTTEEYLRRLLGGQPLVWTSATMVRRDAALQAGGFDEMHMHGEDHALWLALILNSGHVMVSGRVTAIYLHGSASLSGRLVCKPDAVMSFARIFLDAHPDVGDEIRNLLTELHHRFALAHATGALLHRRPDIAKVFIRLAKGTRNYRLKRAVLTLLSMLDGLALRLALSLVFRKRFNP